MNVFSRAVPFAVVSQCELHHKDVKQAEESLSDMLSRRARIMRIPRVQLICIQGALALLLVLLMPFAIDGLDHSQYSIQRAQTHFASCPDLQQTSSVLGVASLAGHSAPLSAQDYRLPSSLFLITTTSASFL
jgi:hypothetical protein